MDSIVSAVAVDSEHDEAASGAVTAAAPHLDHLVSSVAMAHDDEPAGLGELFDGLDGSSDDDGEPSPKPNRATAPPGVPHVDDLVASVAMAHLRPSAQPPGVTLAPIACEEHGYLDAEPAASRPTPPAATATTAATPEIGHEDVDALLDGLDSSDEDTPGPSMPKVDLPTRKNTVILAPIACEEYGYSDEARHAHVDNLLDGLTSDEEDNDDEERDEPLERHVDDIIATIDVDTDEEDQASHASMLKKGRWGLARSASKAQLESVLRLGGTSGETPGEDALLHDEFWNASLVQLFENDIKVGARLAPRKFGIEQAMVLAATGHLQGDGDEADGEGAQEEDGDDHASQISTGPVDDLDDAEYLEAASTGDILEKQVEAVMKIPTQAEMEEENEIQRAKMLSSDPPPGFIAPDWDGTVDFILKTLKDNLINVELINWKEYAEYSAAVPDGDAQDSDDDCDDDCDDDEPEDLQRTKSGSVIQSDRDAADVKDCDIIELLVEGNRIPKENIKLEAATTTVWKVTLKESLNKRRLIKRRTHEFNGCHYKFSDPEKTTLKVNWKVIGNWLGVFALISELGTCLSVAFDKSFEWFEPTAALNSTASAGGAAQTSMSMFGFELPGLLSSWSGFFFICWCMCMVYPFFSFYGTRLAMQGKLGAPAGSKAGKICMKMYSILLNLMSNSLYFPIMKTIITAFSCSYPDGLDNEDTLGTHVNIPSMRCWTTEYTKEGGHLTYVIAACIAILAYYPLASVIYPNLQFASKDSDFKYTAEFILISAQLKLVMSAFAVFMPAKPLYLTLTTGPIFVMLWRMNYVGRPCLIEWANDVRTAIYAFAIVAIFSSFLLVTIERPTGKTVASSVLGCGTVAVLVWLGLKLRGVEIKMPETAKGADSDASALTIEKDDAKEGEFIVERSVNPVNTLKNDAATDDDCNGAPDAAADDAAGLPRDEAGITIEIPLKDMGQV